MLALRLAAEGDLPALRVMMARAIAELQTDFLTSEQVEASKAVMGLDTQLIADGCYFLAEFDGQLAGSGGWSQRATLYGGDHSAGRDARLLDPMTEAARIRAMSLPTVTPWIQALPLLKVSRLRSGLAQFTGWLPLPTPATDVATMFAGTDTI